MDRGAFFWASGSSMSLKAKLEAVVYAAEEPVTLAQLAAIFAEEVLPQLGSSAPQAEPDTEDQPVLETAATEVDSGDAQEKKLARQRDRRVRQFLQQVLDELIADYAGGERGMEIREIAGGYRMATKPEYHDAVRSFVKSLKPPMKLSLQALETLAVIAYKQPVTAPEVSEIRGVDSGGVLGGLVSRISHGDETTIEMSFPAATQLAGTTIAAGAHLLFGGLSATGLEHTLEALRNRMPAHCLGVCLFHLPGTEATRSLTISQVAAAANGMVRPATVSARLLPQGGGRWTVVLSNRGDEDWFDVASPAHIAIHASHGGIHLGAHVPHPGLIRAQVTSETPTGSASPVSACAIDVGVLRAGDVVTIEDLSVDPGCTPIGTIWCRGRSSEVDTAIR